MTTVIAVDNRDRSRRQIFSDLAVLAGGATLLGTLMTPRPAAAKLPQQAISYQPTPKGNARCDNCVQWQSPDACKVVSGTISPSGWCTLYVRKS